MPYLPFLAGERITADKINSRIVEEIMEWTPLASLGSFATNFSAGSMTPRMRKLRVMGTEVWEFEGRISASAFAAATTNTLFTFNVGHRVAVERGFSAFASNSGHYPVRLGFQATGAITASVPTAAGTTTNAIWLDGVAIAHPV
ncbi:hypothetical protein ACWCQL_01440 [Streptomyces sp. NPDC002073]